MRPKRPMFMDSVGSMYTVNTVRLRRMPRMPRMHAVAVPGNLGALLLPRLGRQGPIEPARGQV